MSYEPLSQKEEAIAKKIVDAASFNVPLMKGGIKRVIL